MIVIKEKLVNGYILKGLNEVALTTLSRVAIKMIQRGYSSNEIRFVTGLSPAKINQLKKNAI